MVRRRLRTTFQSTHRVIRMDRAGSSAGTSRTSSTAPATRIASHPRASSTRCQATMRALKPVVRRSRRAATPFTTQPTTARMIMPGA